MSPGVVVLIVAVLLPLLFVAVTYNGLIRIRNHCRDAWSNIDTELKRRYNLIPNLVATVKGYATHEKELLEEVSRLREACVNDHGSPEHQASTENQLIRSLNGLLVRIEAYPELKANQHFLDLQLELVNTEDRIQAARRFYNGNVREYNNRVQMFPSNMIAGMFSFNSAEYFEIENIAAREAPKASY